jgi:hypothetical protein
MIPGRRGTGIVKLGPVSVVKYKGWVNAKPVGTVQRTALGNAGSGDNCSQDIPEGLSYLTKSMKGKPIGLFLSAM